MVEIALKRPYTFIVMAMLIVLATPFALLNMATDIFPEINIPLAASKSLSIPTNALMIRGDGICVAVVGSDSRVHLVPVRIGRNYGEVVEVLEGVTGNEQLVLNPLGFSGGRRSGHDRHRRGREGSQVNAVRTLVAAARVTLVAACAVGPDYRRTAVDMPVAWKIEPPFREAAPDDAAAKGPWWERFRDPQLDALE